jgi:ketosteroid isomerase-like protein
MRSFTAAAPALVAELLDSANAHDTDRQMALYARTPELVFVFDGQVLRGWDALAARQREAWSHGHDDGRYAAVGAPIIQVPGDGLGSTAVTLGLTATGPDGTVIRRTLVHTALWRHAAEGWRIVFAHESSAA